MAVGKPELDALRSCAIETNDYDSSQPSKVYLCCIFISSRGCSYKGVSSPGGLSTQASIGAQVSNLNSNDLQGLEAARLNWHGAREPPPGDLPGWACRALCCVIHVAHL